MTDSHNTPLGPSPQPLPTKHHEPVPANDCVVAWGVYADYDGEAPTTEDAILLSSQELAKEVRELIKTKANSLFVCDGWESRKSWRIRETVAKRPNVVCSFAAAYDSLEIDEEGNDSQDDDENDDGEWS